MKRQIAFILSLLMVLSSIVTQAMGNIEKFEEGDVIVKYIGESPPQVKGMNIEEVYTFENALEGNYSLVHYTSHILSTQALIKVFQEIDGVVYAEANVPCYMMALTDAPYTSNVWYLNNEAMNNEAISGEVTYDELDYNEESGQVDLGIESLWGKNKDLEENVVALIDTGVDYTHPDLAQNMWQNTTNLPGKYGYNFIEDNEDPMDEVGHGTHCAGLIAAEANNEIGTVGISRKTKIMALKYMDETGKGNVNKVIAAYKYVLDAKKQGVNIVAICNSWGSTQNPKALEDIIVSAGEMGIISVCAAGNNGLNLDQDKVFPAGYHLPYTIVVGASTPNDELANFSNYGKYTVDVLAPGTSMLSTYPQEAYIPTLSTENNLLLDFEDGNIGFSGNNIRIIDQVAFEGTHALMWQLGITPVEEIYEAGNINTNYVNAITLEVSPNEETVYLGLNFWSQCPTNIDGTMPMCYVEAYQNNTWVNVGQFSIESNNFWNSKYFKLGTGITKVRLICHNIAEGSILYLDDVGIGKGTGRYCYLQGTSMSAALVAGEVAMLRRLFPNEGITKLQGRVIGGVDHILTDLVASSGRVNMKRAVENPYAVIQKLIQGDNGNIKIRGQFFGINPGTITLNGAPLDIMAWTDTEITAKYMGDFDGYGEFTLTRYDGGVTKQLLMIENKAYKWIAHAAMPVALTNVGSAVYDHKIYVVGGTLEDQTPSQALLVYDIKIDTWQQLSDLPTINHLQSYASGGSLVPLKEKLLYVTFDEAQAKNIYYIYNIKTDLWEEKNYEVVPQPREYAALINYKNEVYMIGGLPRGDYTGQVELSQDIWQLNKDKHWEKVGTLSEGRYAPIVSVIDDQLIITGGYNTLGEPVISTEIYNGKQIVRGTHLPFAGMSSQNTVFGGGEKLYIMTDGISFPKSGIVYIPSTGTWEESPYRLGYAQMKGMGSATVYNKLYGIGGTADYRIVNTLESIAIENNINENIENSIATPYIIGASIIVILIILIVLIIIWMRKRRKPKKMYIR